MADTSLDTGNLTETGQLHLLLPVFRKRLDRAKGIIRAAFNACKNPYLSSSGGKDSTAMLAIVNDVATSLDRDFVIWTHVSDASFPGTLETIQKSADIAGRRLIVDESPVSAFEVQREKIHPFGKKGYFFDAIAAFDRSFSADLAFVGVRASESARRRKACRILGSIFTSGKKQICYPLKEFEVEDVCATIVHYGYPFHPIYSKIDPGGDARNIRLGYVTAQDLAHRGTISFIRLHYPELYQKLIEHFPDRAIHT